MINLTKNSYNVFVHVAMCLNFCVLDSRGGHFGNMQIKKMPPHLFNVITQKWNLEVLRIPKM